MLSVTSSSVRFYIFLVAVFRFATEYSLRRSYNIYKYIKSPFFFLNLTFRLKAWYMQKLHVCWEHDPLRQITDFYV